MPVNQEFVSVSTAIYAQGGFVRRAKGQRRQPDFVWDHGPQRFLFESELPQGWSVQLLGVGPGYSPCGTVVDYDKLAVTMPCGTRFAAYRVSSFGVGGSICQESNYVPS